MGILIVNNMLLTGFDAPVEQVMYLDKVVTNHGLLQAIARVNRVGGEAKEKGFVVDYVGIGADLKKAINAYEEREQKEVLNALSFPEDEYQDPVASHKAISILDDDFEKQVGKRSRTKTKAAEIEHAIRHHLDVDLDDDSELQASFAEALAQIFKDFQDNSSDQFRLYRPLKKHELVGTALLLSALLAL